MAKKGSIHMQPTKAMSAAQSNENERRGWDEERYEKTTDYSGKPCYYDWYRRHLNFEIVKGKICPMLSQGTPLHERLENRLQELGFRHYKKDSPNAPNICLDFVVGGDQERLREMAFGNQSVIFGGTDERNASVSRCQEIENWALDTYRWIAVKYGEENIVGFNVHLDETTPHAHIQVVPVGIVQKRGRVKAGEERKTKEAVSYYDVVGRTPKERAAFFQNLHTEYHLQIGYKYGLERGTSYDELSPEEQALSKHRTGAEYVIFKETMKKVKEARKELSNIESQMKIAEKKLKGLSTMLQNLEGQRDNLEAQIAALEDEYSESNGQLEQKRSELMAELAEIESKIADKTKKREEAERDLFSLQEKGKKLAFTNEDLRKHISALSSKAESIFHKTNSIIEKTREDIKKMDKAGELRMADKHIEARDAVIFRRWPAAKEAVAAIFHLGSSPTQKDFTPQQALSIEKAIASAGGERTDAATDLLSLAEKDFHRQGTPPGWVDGAAREVMAIARGTHQRLNALLRRQSQDAGGGPSYITDLTDWAGNQIKR